MADLIHLYGAIIERLKLDATLVALTEHDPSTSNKNDLRIGRHSPAVKGKKPYLGVEIPISTGLAEAEISRIEVSRVIFHCIAGGLTGENLALNIATAMKDLLQPTQTNTNREYWNVSNRDITNKSTTYKVTIGPDHDDESDSWDVQVQADFIWIGHPCPE